MSCPSYGAPLTKKISDDELSKLALRRFRKKKDEVLNAAYAACISDLSARILHKDLLIRYQVQDLMPREGEYQDEAVNRFVEGNKDDLRLEKALGHYKLGLIHENRKKLKEVAKEYEKATSLFPSFAPAHLRRGMLHKTSKDRKKALKCYHKAGEADHQFVLAFFNQGLMYRQLKKKDEALESYSKCIALDLDNAAVHNNMGLIYMDKREFKNAFKEFEEMLKIFPNHPTGLKNLELAIKNIERSLRKLL